MADRYKIEKIVLRPDQTSRLYEFGFRIRSCRGITVQHDHQSYENPLFDIELPRTAIILREPDAVCGGEPGIARIVPKDREGYVREFRWRPALEGLPARMTGFLRLDEYIRKPEKKDKKSAEERPDAGGPAVHA